jgi:hypothetical protein
MTNCNKDKKLDLTAQSPDELALLNCAKYYGVNFVERNQYNELFVENFHHQ